MRFRDVLNDFNLNYPAVFDIYGRICNELPEKCFYLDRFPLMIVSPETYAQVDVFFTQANNKGLLADYLMEEAKFRNVVKKLWVYNRPILVQTSLLDEKRDHLLETIEPCKKTTLLDLEAELLKIDNDILFEVNNISYLDVLLELGLRERTSSIFIFSIFKTIIWTNDLVMPIYIGDDKYKQIIQKICTTEGLYLRPFKE